MSNLFNFLDLLLMADNFLIPYLQKVLYQHQIILIDLPSKVVVRKV